jgi:hypothetical protein
MIKTKKSFDIYHITDKVYLLLFDELFDLCMHFLRYQEFYESPKFAGKPFTIIEFMEFYAKNYGDGIFTYTKDWSGFNIPSNVIWQVHTAGIADHNKYDTAMMAVYNQISSNTHLIPGYTKHDTFYLLGACKADTQVLGHELAHGLYFTNIKYRDEMTKHYRALPTDAVHNMNDYLTQLGYNPSVFEDELQAYMATGLPRELQLKINKLAIPFEKAFKKHAKNVAFDLATAKPLQLH